MGRRRRERAIPDQYGRTCDKCGDTLYLTGQVRNTKTLDQHLYVVSEKGQEFIDNYTGGESGEDEELYKFLVDASELDSLDISTLPQSLANVFFLAKEKSLLRLLGDDNPDAGFYHLMCINSKCSEQGSIKAGCRIHKDGTQDAYA